MQKKGNFCFMGRGHIRQAENHRPNRPDMTDRKAAEEKTRNRIFSIGKAQRVIQRHSTGGCQFQCLSGVSAAYRAHGLYPASYGA